MLRQECRFLLLLPLMFVFHDALAAVLVAMWARPTLLLRCCCCWPARQAFSAHCLASAVAAVPGLHELLGSHAWERPAAKPAHQAQCGMAKLAAAPVASSVGAVAALRVAASPAGVGSCSPVLEAKHAVVGLRWSRKIAAAAAAVAAWSAGQVGARLVSAAQAPADRDEAAWLKGGVTSLVLGRPARSGCQRLTHLWPNTYGASRWVAGGARQTRGTFPAGAAAASAAQPQLLEQPVPRTRSLHSAAATAAVQC